MIQPWRLLRNMAADVADIFAMPAAVVEGKVAGRYTMAARPTPDTLIVQRVRKRGILAGPDVTIDHEEATKRGIDVAVQPKAGRSSPRPAGTVSLEELMLRSSTACTTVERADDDLAALIYTSGTTGQPRGVMVSHGNLLAECRATQDAIRTDSRDRFASLVPFFHVFGLADGCILPAFRRCAIVLVPQYAPRRFLATLSRDGVTVLLAVPSQYLHLLLAARRRGEPPAVKYCISGASALAPSVIEEFRSVFGAAIVEGYGMTETTSAVTLNPPHRIKPGSIGLPLTGIEVRIVDDRAEEMPPGKAGELLVRGPVVTSGYYHLPEQTAETIRGGWLHTGDIAYCDEEGYLFITDRKKDIIIKGGYNISPAEIESLLSEHPKVREAAVIGIRKGERDEDIKAYVVLAEGESAAREELLDFCRKALAPYKTPDDIVFVDALPRNAAGKVLRRELADDYRDPRLIEREEP